MASPKQPIKPPIMFLGAELAYHITVDLTDVKKEGIVKPRGPRKRQYYVIEYDIVAAVDGPNIRFKAYYPQGARHESSIKGKTSICIAAGFVENRWLD